jgi:hypothetical protein
LLVVLAGGLASACRSGCKDTGRRATPRPVDSVSTASPGKPPPPAATARPNDVATPETLLTLDRSAYHTRLDLASDAIYLLTMEGAFRLAKGHEPQEIKLDLSDNGVATPTAFIFWSKGAFWLAPKRGGAPGRLAGVKDRPIFIVAVDERFAWIGPDEQGHHAVFVLRQGRPYSLYQAPDTVAAATMVEDRVVFIERVGTDSWRLGSVATGGGPPALTATRKGRYPAMLAPAGDVYYYYFDDKDMSDVWAVSPDLRNERVVSKGFICSPLAVSERIFCGHLEGLFEISPRTGLPKLVFPNLGSTITTIAVDRDRVVWVSDVGREKLAVKLVHRNAIPR